MGFTTPNGSYGATMKPNKVMRWFMARQARAIHRGRQKMMGFNALVLVAVGRKSGRHYETPVGYWTLPDGTWVVCASAAGAAKHPSWYRNLAAQPDVTVVIAGQEIAVHAEELHGTDRDDAWRIIASSAPRFATYATKTDGQLPVIRLTRRTA